MLRKTDTQIKMILQRFREAAEGRGTFCADKNEVCIRKGRKTYRFTCGEHELRFAAPGSPVAVFPLAPDATVGEFRRCITKLVDSR